MSANLMYSGLAIISTLEVATAVAPDRAVAAAAGGGVAKPLTGISAGMPRLASTR